MDVIHVSVDAIRARDGQAARASIWCSRRGTTLVEGYTARWVIPTAAEPTVVVVGVYCDGKDDDGNRVTHTLGNVKFDVSKPVPANWYTIYDASLQPAVRTGRARISITAKLQNPKAFKIPRTVLRKAGEKNLQHIAPYGSHGLVACADNLERIHAPYFRTSSGVMLPSGAFLLQEALVEDEDKVRVSMKSRLATVLHRYGMSEQRFVDAVASNEITSTLLRIMVETVSYSTLHKVQYTPDEQRGIPGDRWETVRLPGSYAGDCEDCAKDLVVECMEWSKRGDVSGSTGIDAVARLLSLYVPVMVQGAVGHYKHTKNASAVHEYLNHEWAALHPRKWFEHVTGIEHHAHIDPVHANLPTLVMEGTGEVVPCVMKGDGLLQTELEKRHVWSGPDDQYNFYNFPISCSSPVYADVGVIDFVYTSNNAYGVAFDAWMKREHGIIVAATHDQKTIDAMKLAMAIERPIKAYTDVVNIIRPPKLGLQNAVRVGYKCKEHADDIHTKACDIAREYRDKGYAVDAQVAYYNAHYILEWYIRRVV